MARRVRNAVLDSRDARARLKLRAEPHWLALALGLHLGYRRRRRGGSWVARRRLDSGAYRETGLGLADDDSDANGQTVLSFGQAQTAARGWYDREIVGAPAKGYTVKDCMADYMVDYKAQGKKAAEATQFAIDAHILPKLGHLDLTDLTLVGLRAWHRGLAAVPARVRSGRAATTPRHRKASTDADTARKRQATANRVLTVLKAALNLAQEHEKAASDAAWRGVKPFKGVNAPVIRYLSPAESLRLSNAAQGTFRDLIRAGLLTGCRYSELTALKAVDFNADTGTLLIRVSKGGQYRHVTLTTEGQRFFSQVTAGRASNALLFTREDGKPWGRNHQQRPLTEACKGAAIDPPISFHVLRHTHGSALAMKGVPLSVIAKQLGHADERITSRHYAHLAPSYVTDTIRANFPDLGIAPVDPVVVPHKLSDRRG